MIILKKTTLLRYFLTLVAFVAISLTGAYAANSSKRISREEYINRYKSIAMAHQQRYGIPASITMAQGILESDCGNSHLAKGSNNHFGIKCKAHWKGRTFTHTDDAPDECFRAYDSVEESYEDHAIFLDSSPRYDSLFLFSPTDYRSWARALKGAGYATAPDYAIRLVQLIENNKLQLLDEEAAKSKNRKRGGNKSLQSSSEVDINRLASYGANVDPNSYRVAFNSIKGYNLYRTNKSIYIIAREGDSYKSLASTFKLSESALRRFNDTSSGSTLAPESVVYIEHKQSKWLGDSALHTAIEGETLRSISQTYGIKESALRRHNKIKKGTAIESGETIKLK